MPRKKTAAAARVDPIQGRTAEVDSESEVFFPPGFNSEAIKKWPLLHAIAAWKTVRRSLLIRSAFCAEGSAHIEDEPCMRYVEGFRAVTRFLVVSAKVRNVNPQPLIKLHRLLESEFPTVDDWGFAEDAVEEVLFSLSVENRDDALRSAKEMPAVAGVATSAAPQQWNGQSSAGRSSNMIPSWITSSEEYRDLRAQSRLTLQGVANECTQQTPDGSLIGAMGGLSLVEIIGGSRQSFWRHLSRLEKLGFLVTLGRGGHFRGQSYGNTYGIPAFKGALDGRKARRRKQCMVRCDDGKYRLHVIEQGDDVCRVQKPLVEKRIIGSSPNVPAKPDLRLVRFDDSPTVATPSEIKPSQQAETDWVIHKQMTMHLHKSVLSKLIRDNPDLELARKPNAVERRTLRGLGSERIRLLYNREKILRLLDNPE